MAIKTISIFENGSFVSANMPSSFNYSSKQSYISDDNFNMPLTQISQVFSSYILSAYVLLLKQQNGLPFEITSNVLKHDYNYNTYVESGTFIPIKRLYNVSKITLEIRITQIVPDSSYNRVKLRGIKVTDGVMYNTSVFQSFEDYSGNWVSYDIDITDSSYLDYICIYAANSEVEIRKITITFDERGGGSGSGYIGNSLISNKKMVGYNVPTSSAEATKTESVNEASENPVSGKPKIGNGHARIKLISQAHQNVNISASNQLKNDGVSPTVIDGQMGEYDSNTQSYYFTDACSFTYSNGKISKQVLQSAKRLLFEMEVRLDNESISNYIDASIHMKYGIEGYRLLGVISGNGTITTGDYSFFWMNNGTVQKNDTAPLDVSANRGAFHKVRFELLMNNSTVTTMNCYLDEELYKTKSINQALVLDYDEYNIYCDIPQYAYVRSYKVEVI